MCALAALSFWPAPADARTPLAASFGHAAIVERDGNSVFEVDGAPFFVYGAAFFYERLPRDMWLPSMQRLRSLGINTLDLYVPWNWHEVADGDYDFDGRTSPRRDLDYVLRLAKQLEFHIILRPGPVIRNEWRNGGYPAWLLQRPEYGMPLHDLLEGRYPPTATLQNAHADDAASEWMRNAIHVKYASRWLVRVLHECEPVADRILAVALDDDQGAYIDNQTFPAPHFLAYLDWLHGVVRGVTGPRELVFINTYQMKVPAYSNVWAMGNWYQSEAYALGEHDRAQLEFSTGLLHARPEQPMMASEFQAGWLQAAGNARPRPADPSNTGLALATMIGMGVRGVVNFPAQDTLSPSGWEAPFANAFYAWDSALALDTSASPRAVPTAEIGAVVTLLGPQLAGAVVRYDAAIAYLGGSLSLATATNAAFAEIASQTIAAQQACRDAGLTCALVDPAALAPDALARYALLVIPQRRGFALSLAPALRQRLAMYALRGGRTFRGIPSPDALRSALHAAGRRAVVEGLRDASFARDPSGMLDGFLSVTNYNLRPLDVANASVEVGDGRRIALPHFRVPPHRALLAPVGVRLARLDSAFALADRLAFSDCMPIAAVAAGGSVTLRYAAGGGADRLESDTRDCRLNVRLHGRTYDVPAGPIASAGKRLDRSGLSDVSDDEARPAPLASAFVPVRDDAHLPAEPFRPVPAGRALAYRSDVYRDGSPALVLDNGIVRVVVAPDAGARAFAFEDDATQRNVFSSVGGLRDDVAVEPPLSTVDRIAKYTHDFPAGTFNRPYAADIVASGESAIARFTYAAPDVIPNGATFTRKVRLDSLERAFSVDEGVDFHRLDPILQRAVSVTSLVVGSATSIRTRMLLTPALVPFVAGKRRHVESGNALGFYDTTTRQLATIAWRAGDVEDATIDERTSSIVVRLTLASGGMTHVRYAYELAGSPGEARAALDAADAAAQAPQGPVSSARMPGL